MSKPAKYRAVSNPEMAAAFRGLRASSAASPHQDRRDRRARTKGARLSREMRDSA